ncbi:hypothetical protein LHU53_02105 [Rhodoferax sp. U2-2l]|uniref:hypothetical protein n=1 Tax=Rhodoferax sp. U2-2l TaxID=2884000 RepID=UPI001D0AE81B|nr:hypothetical protein [Rhodoferax sp. U2-2l]MCB8745694.1 hypothetical protein [Rhodoferax sp. U2-2l]
MTPEQKARVSIDTLLAAAGWHVCNVSSTNLHAATGVAIREVEADVDPKPRRAQALQQATLAKTLAAT